MLRLRWFSEICYEGTTEQHYKEPVLQYLNENNEWVDVPYFSGSTNENAKEV